MPSYEFQHVFHVWNCFCVSWDLWDSTNSVYLMSKTLQFGSRTFLVNCTKIILASFIFVHLYIVSLHCHIKYWSAQRPASNNLPYLILIFDYVNLSLIFFVCMTSLVVWVELLSSSSSSLSITGRRSSAGALQLRYIQTLGCNNKTIGNYSVYTH